MYLPFKNLYFIDFEFSNVGGAIRPICAVIYCNYKDQKSEWLRYWHNEFRPFCPPYGYGKNDLVVTFVGEAEMRCMLELDWQIPENHFDCYVENRNLFNGLLPKQPKNLWSLEGTASRLRIQTKYEAGDKSDLRERLGAGTFKESEKENILRYNKEDVRVTAEVFYELIHIIDKAKDIDTDTYLRQALLRGSQVSASAKVSSNGYPVDIKGWNKLKSKIDNIISEEITVANKKLKVWDETGKFSHEAFRKLVIKEKLINFWPRTASGKLRTDGKTLESFEDVPSIFTYRALSGFKRSTQLMGDPIDPKDNRAKCPFWWFNNITSRAAPSTKQHIFNMAQCFRPFIQAQPNYVIIERDYEQQEFGIAAYLSGDQNMQEAYESGDPYLSLGKQGGIIAEDKDKTDPKRDVLKTVCLQLQYGSGVVKIAERLRCTVDEAQLFVSLHQRVFSTYWAWAQGNVDYCLATGKIETKFGWMYQLKAGEDFRRPLEKEGFSLNTLRNWPHQSAGADMTRLAMMFAVDKGLEVVGVVHDCLIINTPIEEMEQSSNLLAACMRQASIEVVDHEIRTEAHEFIHPARFRTKKPEHLEMFNRFKEKAGF